MRGITHPLRGFTHYNNKLRTYTSDSQDVASKPIGSLAYFLPIHSGHQVRWTYVPAGVTQEEGHTGFLIHLPSAVRALIFVARRIQPFLSLVGREVEFCVLMIY